jgi:hypothetical protein
MAPFSMSASNGRGSKSDTEPTEALLERVRHLQSVDALS